MVIPSMEVIWQSLFPRRSRPSYVMTIKTKENLMDRAIKFEMLGKFARDEARDFSDEVWLHKDL